MDIINLDRIKEFQSKNPDSALPLKRWQDIVKSASWRNFQELHTTFRSADYFEKKVIFNIGGNNYRLVAVIDYPQQQVIVRSVMTHSEYNKGNWKV